MPSVLVIISGGIAASKLPAFAASMQGLARLRFIFTESGAFFAENDVIDIKALEAICGDGSVLLPGDISPMSMAHIDLARWADLVLVMPATANILSKMAQGIADDLPTSLLLANDKPVLVVPAMNPFMWAHPALQANVALLKERGVLFEGPVSGMTACGEVGMGRMEAPEKIASFVKTLLATRNKLSGLKSLVTAGPTYEALDDVRFLTNRSSGLQGYAVADMLARYGSSVSLVTGPVSLPPPPGVDNIIRVETALEMQEACVKALPADIFIGVAAVADFRPKEKQAGKIKKKEGGISDVGLVENPDILTGVANLPAGKRPALVIGFCAESGNPIAEGVRKLDAKKCDWIVANNVKEGDTKEGVFGSRYNQITLVQKGQDEKEITPWPSLSKSEVARKLCDEIALFFKFDEVSHD